MKEEPGMVDQGWLDELDDSMELINRSVQLQALIDEGYTEVSFRNPKTNEIRKLAAPAHQPARRSSEG